MKLFRITFILLFIKYCASSGNLPSEQFQSFKRCILNGRHSLCTELNHQSQCPALLENNGELIKMVLMFHDYFSIDSFLLVTCKENEEVFKMIVKAANELRDLEALTKVYLNISSLKSLKLVNFNKYLFETCARTQNYDCIKLFAEKLCMITDLEGRNILHIAAQENDEKMFDSAQLCQLLINEKDFNGKIPMEYVTSRELAQKFNDKWLEVAKDQFLSLESSRIRMELRSHYNPEPQEIHSEESSVAIATERIFLIVACYAQC